MKHERTFEFGRDVLVQSFLVLFFGGASVVLSLMVIIKILSEPIIIVMIPAIYLMVIRAIAAYGEARFALQEWKRWREFLKELDAIKTFDTTFTSHDL